MFTNERLSTVAWRYATVFWDEWVLRGRKRTFGRFPRGVVTTYALEIGPPKDGDNRDQSFSAFRATRYLIHKMTPDFSTLTRDRSFSFHLGVTAENRRIE